MNIQDVIQTGNYTLIDVREPSELMMDGSFEKAINLPTSQFMQRWEEVKQIENPKIVFCRSGGRSAGVVRFLKENGFTDVYDGGGYMMVKMMLS